MRSEVPAPLCARLLERPEDDLHHCPTKKGFTAALSVFCRELTVTRLLIGWKITLPIYYRAVSCSCSRLDWNYFAVACMVSVLVNHRIRFTYVMCRVEIHVARVGSCLACVVCQTRKLQSETFQVKLLRCDKILLVNTFQL
jgi:hypothetical protein